MRSAFPWLARWTTSDPQSAQRSGKVKTQAQKDREAMARCPGGEKSSDHTKECHAAQDRVLARSIREDKKRKGAGR